jgi:hypothetical protein
LAMKENTCMVYLKESDMVYRCHADQDYNISRNDVLLDSLRVNAFLMQETHDPIFRKMLKDALPGFYNFIGRTSWDAGDVLKARKYFLKEIKASPFCLHTWGRLVRTYCYKKGSCFGTILERFILQWKHSNHRGNCKSRN